LIEITFQNHEDAKGLFRYLQPYFSSSGISENNILHFEDQHIVKINSNRKEHVKLVKEVFCQFIIKGKRDDWFRRILQEQYYYEDREEQQQILEIIHSILEGHREDLSSFLKDVDVENNVKTAVKEMLHGNISFSFDSFVKFRMRPLMEQLAKYVEISIDEYKMEQEYQMFIQTLREFLHNRQAKWNVIHLIMDDGVFFYDESFNEFKRAELTRLIDRKLISNHPVYVDSVTIAPLLSIAPETIYLYSDEIEQPLIRTIQNIFEERLVLCPIDEFYRAKQAYFSFANKKI
jgi:putative sporulation protein YtxC